MLDGFAGGGEVGRIYEYRGAVADYTLADGFDFNSDGNVDDKDKLLLHKGNTVQRGNDVYRYLGDDENHNLRTEDFSSNPWQMIDLDERHPGSEDYSDTKLWELADATIRSRAAAASVAFAVGGTGGVAVSGAGAVSTNTILTKTNAYVVNSDLRSAGKVDLDATNASTISAVVAAVSVAASGGGTAGVGASVGVSIANNLIGSDGDTMVPAEVQG